VFLFDSERECRNRATKVSVRVRSIDPIKSKPLAGGEVIVSRIGEPCSAN